MWTLKILITKVLVINICRFKLQFALNGFQIIPDLSKMLLGFPFSSPLSATAFSLSFSSSYSSFLPRSRPPCPLPKQFFFFALSISQIVAFAIFVPVHIPIGIPIICCVVFIAVVAINYKLRTNTYYKRQLELHPSCLGDTLNISIHRAFMHDKLLPLT